MVQPPRPIMAAAEHPPSLTSDRPARWVVCADCDAPVPAFHEDASTAQHGITVWADCPECNVTGISADRTLEPSVQDLLQRLADRVQVARWRVENTEATHAVWCDRLDQRTDALSLALRMAEEAVRIGSGDSIRRSTVQAVRMHTADVEDAHEMLGRAISEVTEAKGRLKAAEDLLNHVVRGIKAGAFL